MTTTKNPYRLAATVVPTSYRIFLTPDLGAATFAGRVEIDADFVDPVREFTVNAIELELGAATVTINDVTVQSSAPTLNEEYETATFAFDSVLPTGPGVIEIAFTGILNDNLHGFYRSVYTDDAGTQHTIATTQFESTDARRAFPCWDEPSFKATYQVSLTIPSHLAAFSNSKEINNTDLGNGQRLVEFAPTMKMSTYLVAFVVGPFEASTPTDVRGTPVRVIYPLGKGHLARYAQEVAEFALAWFADYFAIPYPGDKFDCIAIPDFAAGAMENLGLVTFRETDLLIDPDRASFAEIERVALVINHETAHMWFGDLVTMDWWEGIWLNEAFATFMESLCTDAFRPQWKKWVGFNPQRDLAFAVDALHSTRPIEYEVVSPNDCRGMFDVLTYVKGCSVLRMIEQYLGAETFRNGIRLYLKKHAYGNTVTADLWAALEEASKQPVGDIMNTWILQGGFPLVTLRDGQLSQVPFSYLEATGESNIGHDWQVPVLTRTLGSSGVQRQVLTSDGGRISTDGVTIVNAGSTGFYRTAYGAAELAAIAERLGELDEVERAQMFSDTWAAIMVGRSELADTFSLARGLGDLDEPSAWTVIAQALTTLDRIVDDEGRVALAAATRHLLAPQLARLTWTPTPGESEQAGQLRGTVIDLLGTIGQDAAVIEEALRRFDANEVVGDLAAAILNITAMQDRDGDDKLFEDRRVSAPTPQEEQAYLFSMAANPDPEKQLKLFERCFTDIRNQDAPFLIAFMIRNRVTGASIWRHYTTRYDEAIARFPTGTVARVGGGIAALINDAKLAEEIRAFHTAHPVPAGQRTVEQGLERMDIGVAFANRIRPTLTAQLQSVTS